MFERLAGGQRCVLLATFVRVRETLDSVDVVRSDGTRVSWTFPSYRGSLPHDLIHLVVESAFDLRKSFWAAIDAGTTPEHIHDRTKRGRPGASTPDESARLEMLVAEGLAGIHWYDPFVDGAARCEDIAASCSGFGVAPPKGLDADRATNAHRVLVGLRAAWRRAQPGAPLTLPFDAAAPLQSFEALRHHIRAVRAG